MQILYKAFGWLLFQIYQLVGNYGWAIILFTIVCKLILLPLNIRSTKSMRETQALQPEIQKLQKKYKNSPEKLNQETMKLYKLYNVNPMGGCLPLLLQLPIIYALFGALRNPTEYVFASLSAEAAQAAMNQSWFWLPNLADPDPYYILPVLCAVFTWITQKFTMSVQPTTKETEGTQKMMLWMMPLMIGFMAINMPSGISLYWVVQNVFTFVQQFIMLRKPVEPLNPAEVEKRLEEASAAEKQEKKDKLKASSEAREEMMNRQMGVETKPKKEKKTSEIKMTPASGKKKRKKPVTKIPERKE